ncbi:retrotransposon nucleocapsid protein [Trichosporon asahii var. asahii CBS 8904]|uniref:RNA-directed DNA polymerase n=1 Tax=Trichosporon asahii var. asahii (strain CBS 8904) TaxID=1220162 RepID=K1VUS1_TRIAC|nr:retrotransposon nucleocapsid protein [Trichosporon asahii var. asahii CBS 8904]
MYTRELLESCAKQVRFPQPTTRDTQENYSLVTVSVGISYVQERTRALLDCGALGDFVSRAFVERHAIPTLKKRRASRLKLADGSTPTTLDEEVILEVNLGGDFRPYRARFTVVPTLVQPVILGMPFFYKETPLIDWRTGSVAARPRSITERAQAREEEGGLRVPADPLPEGALEDGDTLIAVSWQEGDASGGRVTRAEYVPDYYHEFMDVFSEETASQLPPHRPFDHTIVLEEGKTLGYGPLYPISEKEAAELRAYLAEMQEKGFIVPSSSPAGSPILFVKKKDGSLRLCVDYRKLNAVTVKNRYPLPLIGDLLDQLRQAKVYSKIDLRGAYHLLRIAEGDEWKTAFRTKYGAFEYKVMPFGLTNAPASFQHLMNHIFRDMLDISVIVYLDDILIFSQNETEHRGHVREVLRRLRENNLSAKPEKCEFHTDRVEFLGFIVTPDGIEMDPGKVAGVVSWPTPTNLKELQSFLGFINFYRRFIHQFSMVARPLHELTRKEVPFEWTPARAAAFDELKTRITSAPILRHFNPDHETMVETDASDYALGAVLSQRGPGEEWRPVAFLSRGMTPPELNYPVHDKEFLAIFWSFNEWRHYLEGCNVRVEVLTDHRSLEYFLTTKQLNRRQARWAEFMADFHFQISYRPGAKATKPDALSRRADHRPGDTAATSLSRELNEHNHRPLLTDEQLILTLEDSGLWTDILEAQEDDQEARRLTDEGVLTRRPDEGLYYGERLYVPAALRPHVLADQHSTAAAGHPGIKGTRLNVKKLYWWPGWSTDSDEYVKGCIDCQRTKHSRTKATGLLRPLPVPDRAWVDISLDHLTGLGQSKGYDAVLVVVDRFTKMAVFVPCHKTDQAADFAGQFMRWVYPRFGLPDSIVSDRGPLFVSGFWDTLTELLGTKRKLSSAAHPQTDGQSEIVNQWLTQFLRIFSNYEQDDWADLLPQAEFAYNSTPHSAIGMTPFEAHSGRRPRRSFLEPPRSETRDGDPAAVNWYEEMTRVHQRVGEAIQRAQAEYKRQFDKGRREAPFKEGELVWLSGENIQRLRDVKKLDYKQLGPYRISEAVGPNAYRLELPAYLRVFNVFHSSLLKPFHKDTVTTRPPPRTKPAHPAPDDLYEVEDIVGRSRGRHPTNRRSVWLWEVKWKGYPSSRNTREPRESLEHLDAFQRFENARLASGKRPRQ